MNAVRRGGCISVCVRKGFMKFNGSNKFNANSWQVFNAILNPAVLQSCIPGCNSVEYLDPTRLRANITTPLPGLKGPYRSAPGSKYSRSGIASQGHRWINQCHQPD